MHGSRLLVATILGLVLAGTVSAEWSATYSSQFAGTNFPAGWRYLWNAGVALGDSNGISRSGRRFWER